jgi:hypothetical protein
MTLGRQASKIMHFLHAVPFASEAAAAEAFGLQGGCWTNVRRSKYVSVEKWRCWRKIVRKV